MHSADAGRNPGARVEPARVRKVAGIAFIAYSAFALFFVIAYAIGSTEFNLPPGPPIFAVVSVALAFLAMTQLARRS